MADPYGLRRVVRPRGVLPQQAEVLDPAMPLGPDELSVAVESLNIDAASFRQLAQEASGDAARIGARVSEIVRARGKMHNPVTGSGGMLIGRIAEVGREHPAAGELRPGDRIATLVSLTLTPLVLDEIARVHPRSERLDVRGRAILFATGLWARLPEDLPESVALAVLDVCGAPAWVARLAQPGQRVSVIGAGTALDYRAEMPRMFVEEGLADAAIAVDATQPLEVLERARAVGLFDLVVNCASVPGTEMGSILAAREGGEVLFFSMATSFTAAALGAEGIGKDVRLTIGNGYARGHAELALNLVRSNPALQRLFTSRA